MIVSQYVAANSFRINLVKLKAMNLKLLFNLS
jgi:hypothetical protein